jgi:hypothetical protein
MFDETTDVSSISQLSLVLTYVYENKRYEDFLDFIDIHDTIFPNREAGQEPKISGKLLGRLVLEKLKHFKFNVFDCVGLATDGCSLMISEKKGAVKEIQSEATNAAYCACYNHQLNLTVSVSSTVVSIRYLIGVIESTISFLTASAKRRVVVDSIYEKIIKKLCETRWVERIDAISDFCSSFETIVEISNWQDIIASSKACLFQIILSK